MNGLALFAKKLSARLPGITIITHTEMPNCPEKRGMKKYQCVTYVNDRQIAEINNNSDPFINEILDNVTEGVAYDLRRRVYGRNQAVEISELIWGDIPWIEAGMTRVVVSVKVGVVNKLKLLARRYAK